MDSVSLRDADGEEAYFDFVDGKKGAKGAVQYGLPEGMAAASQVRVHEGYVANCYNTQPRSRE